MSRPSFGTVVGLLCVLSACGGPRLEYTPDVQAVVSDRLPTAPDDPAWRSAPVHAAELLLQDMVEPRLLEPSTPRVDVRALTDGDRLAILLQWQDSTRNDVPGASRFSDACAVQLPRGNEPDVPAPQMGEHGRVVEIAYWRASWQASVDGRQDSIRALYPGATVDHYPFEAPSLGEDSEERHELERQYAPARALGRAMEGPRTRPVEDLLAEGPGTLTETEEQLSEAIGRRTDDGWSVVIVRPLPDGLSAGGQSQIALAVWNGETEEVGARKMRSGWIPLRIVEEG